MPQLNQRGVIAQAVILILLLLGAVVGVYLVQNRTNLLPKAGGSRPLGPQNSFTLMGPKVCKNGWVCYLAGRPGLKEEFEVKLYAKSDLEEANLFTAKMTFPKDIIEVKDIKTEGSFIKNWVEEFYDNETGEIDLSGGVPDPGYKTQIGQESVLMATITFHAKALGKGEISFTKDSAIYSNLNNINILTMTEGYDISIETEPQPTPVASSGSCLDNLAFKKPVTSSGYWEDGKPERAVDGDLGTAWRTNKSSGAWIAVDLANNTNNVLNISRVKLIWLWDDNFGTKASSKIQVSTDGKNWTDVATTILTKATNKREMQTLDFPSVAARYVRFYGEQWNGGWADMQTFEVYGACQTDLTKYYIETLPMGGIYMTTPSERGSGYAVFALLKDIKGNVVTDQQDLEYTWWLEHANSAIKVEPFSGCTNGIKPPCPLDHATITSSASDSSSFAGNLWVKVTNKETKEVLAKAEFVINYAEKSKYIYFTYVKPGYTPEEEYKVGQPVKISWTMTGNPVDYYNLGYWYYQDGVNKSDYIATVSYPAASYDWTIPAEIAGQKVRVWIEPRGKDGGEPGQGYSDWPFKVVSSPVSSPSPKPGPKGDGNKDGKVNLTDMSVLHTDWNIDKDVVKKIRVGVDMNNDGLINTADFAALRQLLQDLKVIKVK